MGQQQPGLPRPRRSRRYGGYRAMTAISPQARAEMEGIAARLAHLYPETNDQFGVALRPIREVFVGEIRPAVLVLFAAAAFVLLIACANVGNLFVMRGIGRARELSLRMAVGASARRIIAQMI